MELKCWFRYYKKYDMGVHQLWPILDSVGYSIPIEDLAGQKVAVDLACWVVQAKQCKGLNFSRKPHMKNLFYRVSYLLINGITPVFITEGSVPDLKRSTIKERKIAACAKSGDFGYEADSSRTGFDRVLEECKEMLESLGVPCLQSSGEAEAFCAFLNMKGLVDGCITEDNDAFLYGAQTVYRDFSADPKDAHVRCYSMKDIKSKLQLDREKLVALALLLGSDYGKGVTGIGKDTAVKFLEELKTTNILKRFREWKDLPESELFPKYNSSLDVQYVPHCEKCGHPGSTTKHKSIGCDYCESDFCCYAQSKDDHHCSCDWHENLEIKINMRNELKIYHSVQRTSDFPNQKVIDEFLNYVDQVPDESILEYSGPKLSSFQEGAMDWLRWTFADSLPKVLPIVTSWQISQLLKKSSAADNFTFYPVSIIAERIKNGKAYYEIKWESKDNLHVGVNLCTYEKINLFSEAYSDLTKKFNEDNKFRKGKKFSKKTSQLKFESSEDCYQETKVVCVALENVQSSGLNDAEVTDIPALDCSSVVEDQRLNTTVQFHPIKRSLETSDMIQQGKYLCIEGGEHQVLKK